MRLDDALSEFLASPVMIIIGTHDETLQPDIGRGSGTLVHADTGVVEVLLSSWLWPGTARNLRANGAFAATFARPRDYTAYQVKGRATVIEPQAEHRRVAADYAEAIREALMAQGMVAGLIDPWLSERELVVACVDVAQVYEQTPGPRAGRALSASA